MDNKNTYLIGYWSAVVVTLAVLGFALSIIIGMISGSDLKIYSFISSFMIAPAFVAVMIANYYYAPGEKKVWGHLGIAFAVVYAVLIMVVYYLQITVVYNDNMKLPDEIMKLLLFTPGTALFAIDMLGYALMCLATLFGAFVFGRSKLEKWIKGLFIFNGLFFLPSLIFPALNLPQDEAAISSANDLGSIMYLFWCAYFALTAILLAIFYHEKMKQEEVK